MKEIMCDSTFFGVAVSLLTYQLGMWIKKKSGIAIFNPMLFSIIAVIIILVVFKVDYVSYNEGAKYLSYLLTPATVCLAIPLYEQIQLLRENWKAITAGIVSGIMTTMAVILGFSVIFGFSHQEYVTLLPKSITTAIGIGISQELGGMVTITVAVIVITGIFGNIMAETICKVFRIKEPIAKGIGIGSASHAMGTAKAMEMGEIEGAMSSLSIAVSGVLTVAFATIFAGFY